MNILIPICKGMRVSCDIIDAATQVVRLVGEPAQDEPLQSPYELVVSIALVILGITEAGASACHAPIKTMGDIKVTEVLIHVCNVPVRAISVAMDRCEGRITTLQALERGISPLFSVVRSFEEFQINRETKYLEMSPEQRAQEYRSVLKPGSDPDHPEYDKIPVTESDCKERLAVAQATYIPALVGEIALRTGVVSSMGNRLPDLYHDLMYRLSRRRGAAPVNGGAVPNAVGAGGGAPAGGVVPNYDPFDLLAQQVIPEELHGDPVLVKYTCTITMSPIRHPVGDPNGVNLYERSAIIRWIQQHGTSPVTRLPLQVNQLLPKPGTAAIINSRLQFHSNRLRALAATSVAHIAPDPALQGAADLENPRLN